MACRDESEEDLAVVGESLKWGLTDMAVGVSESRPDIKETFDYWIQQVRRGQESKCGLPQEEWFVMYSFPTHNKWQCDALIAASDLRDKWRLNFIMLRPTKLGRYVAGVGGETKMREGEQFNSRPVHMEALHCADPWRFSYWGSHNIY